MLNCYGRPKRMSLASISTISQRPSSEYDLTIEKWNTKHFSNLGGCSLWNPIDVVRCLMSFHEQLQMLHQSLRHKIFSASVVYGHIVNLLVDAKMGKEYVVLLIWLSGYTTDTLNYITKSISILMRILSFI